MFMDWIIQYYQNVFQNSSQTDVLNPYFNGLPMKTLVVFFFGRINKLILKFIRKHNETIIPKTILKYN